MVARRHEDAVTPAISIMLLVLLTVLIAIIIYALHVSTQISTITDPKPRVRNNNLYMSADR
jgi:biopolymer transport protein ExbD